MRKRGRPPYPDILTPREWEVLTLLRDGLTNEQIAGRLNVTRHAVRYHVSEILSKLGVSSRQEAAAWQPEKAKPLWAGALAFALWPLRFLPFGVAARATVATVAIATAGGIGLLAWGLVVTSSEDDAELAMPTIAASPESANTSVVSLKVSKEIDRVMAAANAGSIPAETECSWGTTAAASAYVLTELLVACGRDVDHADFLFQERGSWDRDQPPPETVPPKVFDNLRQMTDFVVAGDMQSGQTAVLWYNAEVADVTWLVLQRPRVLDVVDGEINRLVEANRLDYASWPTGRSDIWHESHYNYFTGELRVRHRTVGPDGRHHSRLAAATLACASAVAGAARADGGDRQSPARPRRVHPQRRPSRW